jgi:hypothetical protein
MRGQPQAISSRLSGQESRRRWSAWISEAIHERRRAALRRQVVIERVARERRSARHRGQRVHGLAYRVRPW